jgi:hypothetical protein
MSAPKKLVLAVIDSLKPEMLDRAIESGRAPALKALVERGVYVRECVSTYPSVTPVASSTIAMGVGPDEHHIPSMNWFHRGEGRYVEYGSSLAATRTFGIVRSLTDTIYNMNMAHLSRARKTVFEHLEDAGLRAACTTYLIYRGRTRHEPAEEGVYSRLAHATSFGHAVWGPTELFYADLFSSRRTGCRSTLGLPGQRDQHTACVGAHLVEHDLFDFLLFSLPDNDTHSHRYGPEGQVTSIAGADRALERVMHVAGGPDAFLEDHAVMVMSDHSQTVVEERLNLAEALTGWTVLGPLEQDTTSAEIAVCPAARSAMVYVLDAERREELLARLQQDLTQVNGIDLLVRRAGDEAAVWSPRGELRFAPGGELVDAGGAGWSVDGELGALGLQVEDGRVRSPDYPDALARLWSALLCPDSGDLLVSAASGYEFVDWGGADHVGGGSHGSLDAGDSLGAMVLCGTGPGSAEAKEQWTLRDAAQVVLDHFSIAS